MAFSTGGRGPFQGQMNITPLIDVLLVLIIVFMVVQSMIKEEGLKTEVPQPATEKTKSTPAEEGTIVLQVVWAGKDKPPSLRINQQDVSWTDLKPRRSAINKQSTQRVAFIKADDDIDFEYVARVIDVANAAGVDRVALMARSQAGQ